MDYKDREQLEREKEAKEDTETMRVGCAILAVTLAVELSIIGFVVWLLS